MLIPQSQMVLNGRSAKPCSLFGYFYTNLTLQLSRLYKGTNIHGDDFARTIQVKYVSLPVEFVNVVELVTFVLQRSHATRNS